MNTRRVAVIAALLGVGAGLAIVLTLVPRADLAWPRPNPNGYDDLLKAGQLVASDPPNPERASPETLRSQATNYSPALALVRTGLAKQCRVPVEFTLTYATNHLADLSHFKRLSRALVAEGKLAELENRPGDAVRAYLDCVRLADACGRGGLVIDVLVAVACQSLGSQALESLAARLGPTECREAIRALEEIDANSEPAASVAQRERAWGLRTFGWRARLTTLIMRKSLDQTLQRATTKLQAEQKTLRQLLTKLAVRAYQLEKGQPPGEITQLSPDYLRRLPVDPATHLRLPLPTFTSGQ